MILELREILGYDIKSTAKKEKKKDKLDYIKMKKCCIKGYYKGSEKITHRLGENICESFL